MEQARNMLSRQAIVEQAANCRAQVAIVLGGRGRLIDHSIAYYSLAKAGLHELGATSKFSTMEEWYLYHLFLAEMLEDLASHPRTTKA